MQFSVVRRNVRLLARGAAVLVVCGAAAGCSSTSTRFGSGLDGLFTASTPKAEAAQPAAVAAVPAGTVSRSALEPAAARGDLPAPASAAPAAQAASAPPAAPSGPKVEVQSGDTIYGLARRHGIPAEQIMAANGLSASSSLKIGQKIVVPGVSEASLQATSSKAAEKKAAGKAEKAAETVAAAPAPKQDKVAVPAQTLDAQAQAKPVRTVVAAPASSAPASTTPAKQTAEVLQESEIEIASAPEDTGIGKMRWPVRGKVVSAFGSSGGKSSDGIDIAVPEGTPVKAAENGVVIYAGDGLKEFGNTVLVRHEDGLVTVYGHASQLKVARGEKVKRGQEIAMSGMSGQTDSPKLHFEVRKNSAPVDPKGFLE